MSRIVVIGDALLDRDWVGRATRLCPDGPVPVVESAVEEIRAGGAGLAATFATRDGAEVTLVTAIGDDQAGARLRDELRDAGVRLVDVGLDGATPEKIRVRADGQSITRIDRGCAPMSTPGPWNDAAEHAVSRADAVLVSDYGRGLSSVHSVRDALKRTARRVPVVWDPHPRGTEPVAAIDLATPNQSEVEHFARHPTDDVRQLVDAASRLASRWQCAIAATVGPQGALVARPGCAPQLVPSRAVAGDTCGAGDRFAATVTTARAAGSNWIDAIQSAVHAATDHVAGGTTRVRSLPRSPVEPAVELAKDTRAAGGTVVAAGGCFDLLHAGHVRMLEAARALGDCLIVCVNSDESVRRLKGRGRPLNVVEDRVAVLLGLGCVDAALVFDEDTPCAALASIRPHLFVKGGDYEGRHLPEQDVLASWGGQLVVLPLVEGRSTTRLVRAAATTA